MPASPWESNTFTNASAGNRVGQALINPLGATYGLISGRDPEKPAFNPNAMGIDRNSKNYAANTEAALLRANWDYSRAELEPLLNRLQYLYNDPDGEMKAVKASREAAGQAFDRSVGGNELTMQMSGLSLTPDQQASYDKVKGYKRNLATGGAAVTAAREHAGLRDVIAAGT